MTVISYNLKKIRESNTSLKQKDIAELLGVKQNTYSTWESGECDVKSEYLPKLAEIFGVKIEDFFKSKNDVIKIKQVNTDNKDNSVNNSVVVVVSDKDSVDRIIDFFKNQSK